MSTEPNYSLQMISMDCKIHSNTFVWILVIMKKAVVQLSGGLDSTTVLALAAHGGYEIYCISFDYGQRNAAELKFAKMNAKEYCAKNHLIFKIDLTQIGKSALTDNISVPKNQNGKVEGVLPSTYVPARNTIFNSIALGYAESIDASIIFSGINRIDYSGYPDCRPKYINAFEDMANLATSYTDKGRKVEYKTPLMECDKAEIIEKGLALNVNYANTVSCYDADEHGNACGQCDACYFRKLGFKANNIADPTRYKKIITSAV